MTTMHLSPVRTVRLDEVKPYWRNPRRVTQEAVDLLAKSISDYGFQQPIVVDEENVIIVGHTRYTALRRLGYTEAPVAVAEGLSAKQVKEYRLIDNRTAEYGSWDHDLLSQELESLDAALTQTAFPEMLPDNRAEKDAASLAAQWDEVEAEVEFTCPHCYHQWEQEVTRDSVLSGVVRMAETTETKEPQHG